MARVGSVWLRWGALLSAVFCLFAQESSCECLDKDQIVAEMSKDAELPSECVLSCTALTYRQILDRQQKLTVRFKDSQPGEAGDFCWSVHTRCSTWDEVFVLLSIKESAPAGERVVLQTDWSPVEPHDAPSVLPDACGLRFDVTPHLRVLQQRTLCVRPHGIMGNSLQCPPFLVIIRKKSE